MHSFRFLLLLLAMGLLSTKGQAQLREIPREVKAAFENQYPGADSVTYDDRLIQVQVHFRQTDGRYTATYSNRGEWKETLKAWTFEALPEAVRDGFSKSKYADWKVTETKVVLRSGNAQQYRLRVEKNDIQKKNLLFHASGRLLEDVITL